MPLGRLIDDETKRVIAEVYTDHTAWIAKQIQTEVIKRIQKKHPNIHPGWPGLSAVQKEVKKIQDRGGITDPQEKSWSITTLDDYPISPGSLPVVLKVYKRHQEDGTPFTVRQAKWVSRLSATQYAESLPDTIARQEQIDMLTNSVSDYSVYDKLLSGLPGYCEDLAPLFALASLSGILDNDPTKKEAVDERRNQEKQE